MPIYAYKCATCGHADDVMQKMSDAVLTTCPQCAAEAYGKQLTAPGFALKGSGWYVTDFKGGNKPAETKTEAKTDSKTETQVAPAAAASPAASSTPAAPSAAPVAT